MSSNVNVWKLGLFVLVGIAAGLGFLTWLGLQQLQRETHTAYAYFDESVNGLEPGSPVKFRGVTIGEVAQIGVAPDKKHVEIRAELYDERMREMGFEPANLESEGLLPQGLRVQLITNTLTGTAFIQADFFDEKTYKPPEYNFEVKPNTVPSVPSTFKSLESGIIETINAIPELTRNTNELLHKISLELDELDLPKLTEETRKLVEELRKKVEGLEQLEVVAEATAAFREAKEMTGDIRKLVDDWYSPEGPFKSTAQVYRDLAKRLEQTMDEMQLAATSASFRSAGSEATQLGRELRGQIDSLRNTIDALGRLASMLERDPGALLHGRSAAQSPAGRGN